MAQASPLASGMSARREGAEKVCEVRSVFAIELDSLLEMFPKRRRRLDRKVIGLLPGCRELRSRRCRPRACRACRCRRVVRVS